MDIINRKKNLYETFINFIDSESDTNEYEKELFTIINNQKIIDNRDELREFLELIKKIVKNHHRHSYFFHNILAILLKLKTNIKGTFSNYQIFDIFKSSKPILLLLFQNDMITPEKNMYEYFSQKSEKNYTEFFYPEIESFLNSQSRQKIAEDLFGDDSNLIQDHNSIAYQKFNENRLKGENDHYICQVIRDDLIDDFIVYVNKKNISLSIEVPFSLFETNSLLLKKVPTLLEYAAFFGSIQIFQYLRMNGIEIDYLIWTYVIHGRNPEMIHLLESNRIKPRDILPAKSFFGPYYDSYRKYFEESIKCHHNEITTYIQNNFLNQKIESFNILNNYDENAIAYGFHYYNYEYLPNENEDNFEKNKFIFYYACQYNYISIVKFFIENKMIDVNDNYAKF